MIVEQDNLVARIRGLLAAEPVVREVSMFGGRAFMVNEKMIVSAQKDGGLLVRVAAERDAECLKRPGAARAEMGAGRDMGPGWIDVASDAISDAGSGGETSDGGMALASWVEIALEYNREVTAPN